MKKALSAIACGLVTVAMTLCLAANPPGIPRAYRLLYGQSCSSTNALREFVFTDSTAWRVTSTNGKSALELLRQSDYQPAVRSPVNIALVADRVFDDFILEADLLQTSQEHGHRDMCLFYGFQSPTQFYYTHIATKADDHAHNCFLVNQAPRTKIAKETTGGFDWGRDVWHKVRLERKASDGTIRVWIDDLTRPIMVAEDRTLGPGWVGFGSFDDTGRVANIRVWGRKAQKRRVPEFPKRPVKPTGVDKK